MSKSWPNVKLGAVLTPAAREEAVDASNEYRLLGVRLDGHGPFLRETVMGTQTAATKLYRVTKGDFIYSRLFACRGAFGVIDKELDGCYVSGEFPTFIPMPGKVDAEFLKYWFRLPSVIARVDEDCTGSTPLTRNRFKENFFLALEIPLPPINEQQRIVAHIEKIAAQVDEARALRREAGDAAEALEASATAKRLSSGVGDSQVKLPEFRQSVRRGVEAPRRLNAVAAGWKIPKGWMRVSVAELLLCGALVDVKDGNHGANHPRSGEFVEDGTPFLMASDIYDGSVTWAEASRLGSDTLSRLRIGFSQAGDVLFTHKASIGRTAIADRDCVLSPQVTYYRCNNSLIDPKWLQQFLGSSLFLSQLSDIQAQSTRDFVSISKQYQQFLLLPPLAEQHRIVVDLEALQAEVDTLKHLQAETAAELDALLPSILDHAFRGGL